MKRRGKRITFGVMGLGLAVVILFTIAYRKRILEHVEAWHFQLTRKTETIEPDPALRGLSAFMGVPQNFEGLYMVPFKTLAHHAGLPVVFDVQAEDHQLRRFFEEHFGLVTAASAKPLKQISIEEALEALRRDGFRVLQQLFPRRAYVVMRDPAAGPVLSETLFVPIK